MLNKRISNIVFYKVPNGTETKKQATIFYSDGSVSTVSFEEGIDACEVIVQERHIQTKDAFKEMINRDVVHVMSLQEFKENFNSFVPDTKVLETEETHENLDSRTTTPTTEENTTTVGDLDHADIHEEENEDIDENEAEDTTSLDDEEENEHSWNSVVVPTTVGAAAVPTSSSDSSLSPEDEDEDEFFRLTDDEEDEIEDTRDHFDGSEDFDEEIEEPKDVVDAEEITDVEDLSDTETEEKPGFFRRVWNKIRKNKVIKGLILCVTALAVACGIYSCAHRRSLEGEMASSNLPRITHSIDEENNNNDDHTLVLIPDDEDLTEHYYNDATLKALFARTSNENQKTAMNNIGLAMDGFNNEFSSHYLEEGLDVRATLKFDEVVALQVAYNDYNREQLVGIFNGADIRSSDLSRAYKDASLQLMGAYAIENSEHPVDMSMLIESQEGKDFYQRYHEAFLAAKEATGDEKIRLVTEFYNMVHADFPITEKVRTEGISHAENYETLTAYKLSVAPMIAAGEMMWQNLAVDATLNDSEIDFLNDLGLCNFADKTFERAELLALSNPVDKNNPTFEEYRDAFIKYYTAHGIYYIDDEHRELTKLHSFQDAVNWHLNVDEGAQQAWSNPGTTTTTTTTTTEEVNWTDTQTTYWEETTTEAVDASEVPVEIRVGLQQQVDADFAAENERARQEAEAAAEAERQRLQAEADAEAARIEEEIRREEEDLQNNIAEANAQINANNSDNNSSNDVPINESDLGHGVDFDDQHSDANGNLDSSVENITTDSTGDMTGEPLPDPNATGAEFDAQANGTSYSNPSTYSAPVSTYSETGSVTSESTLIVTDEDQWVDSTQVADDYYYEDSWIEYEEDYDYSDAVDSYVETLVDEGEDIEGYQYQKQN